MKLSRFLGGLAAVLLMTAVLAPKASAFSDDIYRSRNKIDFIKLDKANKKEKEGGLSHPYTFSADQMRAILGSVHFNKKILILKDIENRRLFDDQNVEFLTPYLIEAFQKAKEDEVVVASYFTRDSHVVIQNDRLTVFRAFVKEDGLHIRFTKLYAKMLGDRITQGSEAATSQARGMRVALELQEGQNRISWDPEELVFDLNFFKGDTAVASSKEGSKDKKSKVEKSSSKEEKIEKAEKVEKTEKKSKADKKTAKAEDSEASSNAQNVRERLKELDQLKKDEMITEKEYQEKRRQIIKEL